MPAPPPEARSGETGPGMPSRSVRVAAAAIFSADGGRVLLARRSRSRRQSYAGYWEFPGGKIEPGEAPADALVRELREEVNIVPTVCRPLIEVEVLYRSGNLNIKAWHVSSFSGEPFGAEDQEVGWFGLDEIEALKMPDANCTIVTAARLPDQCLITPDLEITDDGGNFFVPLARALADGIRLVLLRLPRVAPDSYRRVALHARELCRYAGARLLLHAAAGLSDADLGIADGVHLDSRTLVAMKKRPPLAKGQWLSAAVHNARELQAAREVGADFLFASPVAATASHPQARPLGWQGFKVLSGKTNRPIYALGGLGPADCNQAWQHGGQGVAGIRAFWPDC